MQRHSILRKHLGGRASKTLTSVSGGVSRQEGLMPGPHISSGSLRSPSPGLHFAKTVLYYVANTSPHKYTRTNTPHKILADLFVLTSIKYSIIPIQLTRFLHCISYFSKSSKSTHKCTNLNRRTEKKSEQFLHDLNNCTLHFVICTIAQSHIVVTLPPTCGAPQAYTRSPPTKPNQTNRPPAFPKPGKVAVVSFLQDFPMTESFPPPCIPVFLDALGSLGSMLESD